MMSIFHHLQAGTGRILQGKGLRHLQLTLNLLILAGWIWLYYPVFSYLKILFSHEEFRTNQVLLAAVAGLLFVRAREAYQDGQRWNLSSQTAPHLWLPGLGLALGGSLAYLLAERYLDINTLSATLFGLASYGLLGLWIAPQRWRASLPAALLVIGVLPFGEHMQTFIGYPLRAITAAWVQHGLLAMGVQSVGVDTILVFENSVTQVDIPCSGVKSLWTGSLFWLAATWIDARRVNLRWLLAALVFGLLLLLAQFTQLQNGRQYDAILVLTDGTGYELGPGSAELPNLQTPVWMVHLGGQLPLGYDDPTLEAIQASGGGITAGLQEALERIAAARSPVLEGLPPASLVDGYLWLALPAGQADAAAARLGAVAPNPDFAPLAARRLILAEMALHQGKLEGLDTLDGLHAIAVENSIVTPYSSMIVLVTQQQEQRLDALEKQADRFTREQEAIGETPTNQFAVTGVPEPEEWLLIFLAAGMLVWYAYRQKTRRKAGTAGARLRLDP